MATTEINQYIEKRYQGLLDYSAFHCSRAGIPDESIDVLNEVLLSLLQMDDLRLQRMYEIKKCKYTELDFFILRMIKLNCYSETAPYRSKCRPIPSVTVNLARLKIIDDTDEETDHSGYVFDRMSEIRNLIESMGFSEKASFCSR